MPCRKHEQVERSPPRTIAMHTSNDISCVVLLRCMYVQRMTHDSVILGGHSKAGQVPSSMRCAQRRWMLHTSSGRDNLGL